MEILIPGLILVGLMVWLSTRIKRNASAAFDAERVETDELVVDKPAGLLHVLNDKSGLLFRAYSKDFGTIGRREIRQATIEVERHAGIKLDDVIASVKAASESFRAEPIYMDRGERALNAHSVRTRDGAELEIVHKFVTRGPDVIEARGEVLAEHKEAHSDQIASAIDTLQVK